MLPITTALPSCRPLALSAVLARERESVCVCVRARVCGEQKEKKIRKKMQDRKKQKETRHREQTYKNKTREHRRKQARVY